jgi:hypothetical protein
MSVSMTRFEAVGWTGLLTIGVTESRTVLQVMQLSLVGSFELAVPLTSAHPIIGRRGGGCRGLRHGYYSKRLLIRTRHRIGTDKLSA